MLFLGFNVFLPHLPEVTLTASLGTLNTLADIPDSVVQGRGQKQLTISTSNRKLLNFALQHVTYSSTVYQLHRVDVGESLSLDGEMLGSGGKKTPDPLQVFLLQEACLHLGFFPCSCFQPWVSKLPNYYTPHYPHVAIDPMG